MFPRLSAPRLIVLAFAALVLIGTLLLKIPAANNGISWMDAFFESVSAVTVTGLQAVVPAEDFTPLGQAILAGLIQLGGLGIMTLATVGALLIGRRMGFRDLLVVREELASPDSPRNVLRLVGQVALITILVEAVGVVILTVRFAVAGHGVGSLGLGLFHSIAAFCNAGFDIFEGGMATYAGDWTVNLTLIYLIIAGGLGFPVLVNLYYYRRVRRLTLQSKLVLITSAVLVVVGVLSVALLEWTNPRTLGGEPLGTKVLMSLFQGVSPRTAGFATVTYSEMHDPTLMVQMALMFIGTAPVSTGGGIKVTTVALLFLILLSQVRGHEDISAFGRRIPRSLIAKSVTVMTLSTLLVVGAALALMISAEVSLLTSLFEITSAFGTVGLSLGPGYGLATELGPFGKILLALVMFAGRVGPITLAVALSERDKPRRYSYPEEEIAIG
ncbi:MAG: TrkH family potassium uptake protein [Actinomycetota bacterium]|nr:TrkH family potassium uptake protein [Actinomycetota bacterium]